jgi:hypothetical protein
MSEKSEKVQRKRGSRRGGGACEREEIAKESVDENFEKEKKAMMIIFLLSFSFFFFARASHLR